MRFRRAGAWWVVPAGVVTAAVMALPSAGCSSDSADDDAASATSAPVIDVGDGDGDSYAPAIDPAAFVEVIDNPHMPLSPGSTWIYEGTDGDTTEHIEVQVTKERREVMGISAVVVHDTVSENGEIVEDTFDWYAQDVEGNVWYLGEDSREFEDGEQVSTAGSWEAGVDGAQPGIVMKATPEVGDAYRQEFLVGEAEDMAEVVELGASESVPAGAFDRLVVIREWNPLEPDVVEEKYYAPGVGVVLEEVTEGGAGRIELVEYLQGP